MKIDELASILENKIKEFDFSDINLEEEGKIISLGDGICTIYGLNNAMIGELILFENKMSGMVLNLEEEFVGAVLLGSENDIKEGQSVFRTKKVVETNVGDELLGRVIDGLGNAIDGLAPFKNLKKMPIEIIAPSVMQRQTVNQPVLTGIIGIDSMIPIGKGQRELIIGDRQTGKTAIILDTIINQKNKNVYCVYVAIGQKNSTIGQIVKKLQENDALEYTTIIATSASEQPSLLYLSPYIGITIAEYWMWQGKDVVIVYDDLSKHAIAYRSLSLLLRRPPGREAYPGDIFYLHSRLLERACKLSDKNGGGSITAFPIIETQAGDISAYIPTNVISITDGQIFLSLDLFNLGQRPGINYGLSVSRVGSAAQTKIIKVLSSKLKLELAQYYELQSFSQFGSDIDKITAEILDSGEKILEILKQSQFSPLSHEDQALLLFFIKEKFIRWIPKEKISEIKTNLPEFARKNYFNLIQEIEEKQELTKEIETELFKLNIDFIKDYIKKSAKYDTNLKQQFLEFSKKHLN
ncbi:F0F1 ATP synthase subunit alpha [symbiont of Argiope bruennichi]|uniref:F0F1 ATP synthase subunit alpha n=1 Tax=symbiont of Argiope bruennichi TaxID=2810479 RepID=UPI003DA6B75A